MLATGSLGTRADAFVDVTTVFLAAAPFLVTHALRLAGQRCYRAHRRLQVGVLLEAIVPCCWRAAWDSGTLWTRVP